MNSTIDQAYVAKIVRQVIARLKQSGMMANTQTSNTQTSNTAASISDKIITATLIEQLPGAPKQVFVSAKAIVTPAAKDSARQRGVTIARSVELPKAQVPVRDASRTTIQNITDDQNPERAVAVAQQLSRRGIEASSVQIVLSEKPAADVFRLCSGGQRAAMIGSTNDVDRFASELQPTVWVLDMKRLNLMAAVNAAAKITSRH